MYRLARTTNKIKSPPHCKGEEKIGKEGFGVCLLFFCFLPPHSRFIQSIIYLFSTRLYCNNNNRSPKRRNTIIIYSIRRGEEEEEEEEEENIFFVSSR